MPLHGSAVCRTIRRQIKTNIRTASSSCSLSVPTADNRHTTDRHSLGTAADGVLRGIRSVGEQASASDEEIAKPI